MNNEIKKRLPLQCPACDTPLKVGPDVLWAMRYGGVRYV